MKPSNETASATELPAQPEPATAASASASQPSKPPLPYKAKVDRFTINKLALHAPAYLGTSAQPIELDNITINNLPTAAEGTAVDDIAWQIIGQIIKQILTKNPLLAVAGVVGGGLMAQQILSGDVGGGLRILEGTMLRILGDGGGAMGEAVGNILGEDARGVLDSALHVDVGGVLDNTQNQCTSQ